MKARHEHLWDFSPTKKWRFCPICEALQHECNKDAWEDTTFEEMTETKEYYGDRERVS